MEKEKIQAMRDGGKILSGAMDLMVKMIKPGLSEIELDKAAEDFILKQGGKPGFKMVPGYHHTTCISVNDVIVHGIPSARKFREGDIIGIDCGVFYKGYHTDMSETVVIPPVEKEHEIFIRIGKLAMFEAIKEARPGNRIGNISKRIQDIVGGRGYFPVKSLTGHGVGKELHEAPEIPGFLKGKIEKTPLITKGMTLAIEVIYGHGTGEVVYKGNDEWSIAMEDGSMSGLYERTVLVTENGPELLTILEGDEKNTPIIFNID